MAKIAYKKASHKEKLFYGGRNRTRTCDPIDVNDVLYQLSHGTMPPCDERYCSRSGALCQPLKRKKIGWGEYGRDGAGQREAAAGCGKRMFSYIHIEEKEVEDAEGGKIPAENPGKPNEKRIKNGKIEEKIRKYRKNTMEIQCGIPRSTARKWARQGKTPPDMGVKGK